MRTDSIGSWMAYYAGGHVLLDDMYCWRTCSSSGHVFHENICQWGRV